MCETDLRNEILQSTQRLMNQIDQIKPVEINPEEIEKSQAFINQIESEQIQNIEKSHSLLRDVTNWGDKRKDQYDEFEKPLLNTVENSVHVSEEVTKSAIPLLQEKINNYDRHLGDLKASIASMGDVIAKTAKEAYEMKKTGNEPSSKPEEITPFFQFSPSSNLLSQNDNEDNGDTQQKNNNEDIDNDTSYDMIQSLKLREEHLLNVVKSLSNELKALKSTIKTEQNMSKNFHYELEYLKSHTYSPTLEIDSGYILQHEQIQNTELQISLNNIKIYEIPLEIIEHKDKLLGTKDFEEVEEQTQELPPKIIMYQNFEIADIDPNQNYDFLKNLVINEIKEEYYSNLKDQSIQNENKDESEKEKENGDSLTSPEKFDNIIESFEIVNIISPQKDETEKIGKVTITKEKGNNHHIFNYSEDMNSEQVADDLDELINFHRSCTNNESESEIESDEDDEKALENDNDLKLQQLKLITDFKHAAKIIYNTKTGKREIITENNVRIELTPTNGNDNTFSFTSMNGQHLNVVLIANDNQINDVNINLNNDEVVDNRSMYIANEKNGNDEEIKLQVIINKDGESFVTNNDSEAETDKSNSSMFIDSNGSTFIYDSSNSIRIPVFMNETGQIMYEMANSEFIQVAMMNLQSELYYINDNGEKMLLKIDENGNFYVLSHNGQRIPIDIFKNLNVNDQISTETNKIKNNNIDQKEKQKRVEIITKDNEQTEANQNTNTNENDNEYQYKGSNDITGNKLVPVSISRKDNELKIIYQDKEDAVVVNTNISHTTENGQIILRPSTNPVINQNKSSNLNLAVKGVKFNFNNDNPQTRITRIVGGFNKTFMRQSRRKKFNWTVRPARQIVKLNIEPRPPRCFYHQSYRDRLAAAQLANKNKSNEEPQSTQKNATTETCKNIPLRWMALPVRPPPPCCRKGLHNDLNLMTIISVPISTPDAAAPPATAPTKNSNQTKEVPTASNQYQSIMNDLSNKPKYIFNKRKIVQPDSKHSRAKMIQEQNQFKSEQSGRKVTINSNTKNQKYPASPSPRRQLQHQKIKHLNPLTPSLPKNMSIQPAPRIKFTVADDCENNANNTNSDVNNSNNYNTSTVELPQM